MRFRLLPIFLGLFAIQAKLASAYPNFISLGYQTCNGCHYNPYGNGPLTDYGRSVAATAIADRLLVPKRYSNDDINNHSGFFFNEPKESWFRPSASYRGLYLSRNFDESDREEDYFHMDASVSAAMKFLKDDRLTIVGNIGYAPVPKAQKNEKKIKKYRSREHYIGFRFVPQFGLYAGLMDKVFGLRVPDHVAFSRQVNQLTMNDQTHGVLAHAAFSRVEFGLHGFAGNMAQKSELRQKGFSTQVEVMLIDRVRLGTSYQSSKSKFIKLTGQAAHLRAGISEGTSIMLEVGKASKKGIESDFYSSSFYTFLQNQIRLRRGLFSVFTSEYLKPQSADKTEIYRNGPGFQFFPGQRVELRVDFYNTKTVSRTTHVNDNWDFAGQVHLWF